MESKKNKTYENLSHLANTLSFLDFCGYSFQVTLQLIGAVKNKSQMHLCVLFLAIKNYPHLKDIIWVNEF